MTSSNTLRYVVGTGDPFVTRNAMVWGVDMPTTSNVGIVAGFTRNVYTGDLVLNVSGDQTYMHYDFHGRVDVRSSGTKYFRNCRFYGAASPVNSQGLLHCTNASITNVVVEDSELIPETPSLWFSGALGHHFTLRRCKIQNCVDGIGVFNTSAPTATTGVVVELCYIGEHSWFYDPPSTQADGSHNDGVQFQGGDGSVIRGNFFNAYNSMTVGDSPYTYLTDTANPHALSCLMYTPNVGAITNTIISNNWMFGAQIAVNAGSDANGGHFLGTFTDNRFNRDQYYSTYTLSFDTNCTYTASGNVYDDDDSAVTVRHNQ
jgi:hypothetical protein